LTVKFESGSRLQRIEKGVFSNCSHLRSISIPASVLALEQDWAALQNSLGRVKFESGGSLKRMIEGDEVDSSHRFVIFIENSDCDTNISGYSTKSCLGVRNLVRFVKR
jgi:hypothetical protein